MRDLWRLLPDPDDGYRGTKASLWFLVALSVLVTVRSLVHMFAPDGGANSIAGLTVEGAAGDNLIHLFAQWGLEQLLLAVVAWVAILRYRFLVPFVLLLQLIDWIMRGVMGEIKPLIVDSMPPGGIGNIVLVPLVAIALWFSLPRSTDPGLPGRGVTQTDGRRASTDGRACRSRTTTIQQPPEGSSATDSSRAEVRQADRPASATLFSYSCAASSSS